MQVMAQNHSGGGSEEPLGALGRRVQFWTSFSEKMCENPSGLHGLGAARKLKLDLPDPPDPADLPEMVHGRHFGPQVLCA